MAKAKKGARKTKPQEKRKHPDKWERDLNAERLEGQNLGSRRVDEVSERSAADLKEFADVLSSFRRDELKQIAIVPAGMRLKQGAVYLDLNNPRLGPITATADLSAGRNNLYIAKAELPYEYWNRLMAIFSADDNTGGKNRISEEMIDRALADSFPASDPPSWNMGKEPGPRFEKTERLRGSKRRRSAAR